MNTQIIEHLKALPAIATAVDNLRGRILSYECRRDVPIDDDNAAAHQALRFQYCSDVTPHCAYLCKDAVKELQRIGAELPGAQDAIAELESAFTGIVNAARPYAHAQTGKPPSVIGNEAFSILRQLGIE